jgi:hypothetical protein
MKIRLMIGKNELIFLLELIFFLPLTYELIFFLDSGAYLSRL